MNKQDIAIISGATVVVSFVGVGEYYDVDWMAYASYVGNRLLWLGVTVGAGYIVGAVFSEKLRKFRSLLLLAAMALVLLYGLFVPTEMGEFVAFLTKMAAAIVAFSLGIRLGRVAQKNVTPARPTSYGSAKWATFDYLAEHNLFAKKGFLLGFFRDGTRGSWLTYAGARHMLTVAPTRSGKGVSSIIPCPSSEHSAQIAA